MRSLLEIRFLMLVLHFFCDLIFDPQNIILTFNFVFWVLQDVVSESNTNSAEKKSVKKKKSTTEESTTTTKTKKTKKTKKYEEKENISVVRTFM